MIELLNMDCMEYMAGLEDNAFDLAAVDPIYGINGDSHRKNKSRGRIARSTDYHPALWDQKKTGTDYFNLLFKKSKKQIVFGGNYFESLCDPFKTPRRHEAAAFIDANPTGWILWDKVNGTTGFNDYEMIWCSFPVKTHVFKFMWNGFMQGYSINNGEKMNPHKKANAVRIHPTQKPVPMYQYLFYNYCQFGESILDTHLGSGSSALAANDLGFQLTGCEIETTYYNAACKRFKLQTSQLSLL